MADIAYEAYYKGKLSAPNLGGNLVEALEALRKGGKALLAPYDLGMFPIGYMMNVDENLQVPIGIKIGRMPEDIQVALIGFIKRKDSQLIAAKSKLVEALGNDWELR